ncbi:DNA primase [Thermogemmatispora tikiterensis]|uniref:DNA primase n=1 Tax=Thermogemmatispora tikiterensis TaxID=1825093 RepID=A0A328VI21_9CHLR|nr:DNA primase [Thermogemmatispora tikiterensis]RAQ96689.1 DNA primase [Thermogemmatispora tikiterensis]
MSSIIETIKARLDLVDEVGQVVKLQKTGRAFKALCPFHNERTPSFYVFPESQHWHCFGCHESGDIFTFVQKAQGLDFPEALRYLAEKAGVSLDEQPGYDAAQQRELAALRERLRHLNEDAQLWFHQALLRLREAAPARAYLQGRGLTGETVIAFGLGYAPDSRDALCRYLLSQGYSEQELVSAGLAREPEDGQGLYDYFRNRIMFPIRDLRGQVIGFGGRTLGDGQPKYLNTPQTALFEKNSVLYALDRAKEAIKQANQVIIVEGYIDAIMAHQYGTRQTVACIGSAITEKHIQQIKKLARRITLALDPDAAGMAATEHGIQEALRSLERTIVPVPLPVPPQERRGQAGGARAIIRLEEEVDAQIDVLLLPAGQDPDEVIRQNPARWEEALAHPLPLVDYYFVAKTTDLDLRQPRDQALAARRLLPIIGIISDRVKRDAYVRKLARMIHVDEQSLYNELQRSLRGRHQSVAEIVVPAESGRREVEGSRKGRGRQRQSPQAPAPLAARPALAQTGLGASGKADTEALSPASAAEVKDARAGALASARVSTGPDGKGLALDRGGLDRVEWEDYLIGLLLQHPGLSQHVCGIINDGDFIGTDTRELYHFLNSLYQRGSSSFHQPLEQLLPSALLETAARAQRRVEAASPLDGAGLIKAATQCATRLKRMRLMQLNTELRYLIQEAREAGDLAAVHELEHQLQEIHRQIREIHLRTNLQG